MNDRRIEIGSDVKEVVAESQVHERAGQPREQGPRLDTRVVVRVASPGDLERLREMFSRVSNETIYRRFHIPYPRVPEQVLAFMLDIDEHDKQSIFAVKEEEIVGHAMYARFGNGEAEVAIVVEDRWQSKGLGRMLLSNLAEDARRQGVKAFVGTVLLENQRMLSLIDAVFADSRREIVHNALRFRAPLRTLKLENPVRTLRRVA